jgi:ferritin-like metal-binding protein YciE
MDRPAAWKVRLTPSRPPIPPTRETTITLQTLEDLLVHQIQDILSAEHQVRKALPGMAEAAGSDELRQAFTDHQKETDTHIERLHKAFQLMDKPVSASQCEAAMKAGSSRSG